jgi:hypothetical protein
MPKYAVSVSTLERHNHIIGDIARGVKVYENGGIEFMEFFYDDPDRYIAKVPHKGGVKNVSVLFSRDGRDIEEYFCDCTWRDKEPPVCRHVVAAVLAIQNGISEGV